MNYSEILKKLTEMYEAGATQKEIADRAGWSHQYISQLMTGKVKPESLSLRKLSQLFPDARIVFGDDARIIGDVTNNKGQVVNVNGDVHGTVDAAGCAETAASFLKRIMESSDFDSDTKVKLFNLLNQKQ